MTEVFLFITDVEKQKVYEEMPATPSNFQQFSAGVAVKQEYRKDRQLHISNQLFNVSFKFTV